MSIFTVGINHKTAPVMLREQVYFRHDQLSLYLRDLLNQGYASEAVLLSTCNRSELYCETDDIDQVCEWFCAQSQLPRHEVETALYVYRDEKAIAHLMEVACGLDSMILGEPQILGQVKEAFSESCAIGAVNGSFYRLFQQIFNVAKEIRSVTAIGACPVSVASAAVHLIKQQAPLLSQATVLLIGAGDTVELLMRYLKPILTKPILLVNRSLEKASKLLEEMQGHLYGLERLPCALAQADVVFSATGSVKPIVDQLMMEEVMRARAGRPITMMDVAVPRDIDNHVAMVENVRLFCIDDLKAIIEGNRQGREHAATKAREMIIEKSNECLKLARTHDHISHTIRQYRGQIESLCIKELDKAKQLLNQGNDAEEVLESFARNFTNKLLHSPSVQLRQAGVEGRFELLRFAKQLFSIADQEVELS